MSDQTPATPDVETLQHWQSILIAAAQAFGPTYAPGPEAVQAAMEPMVAAAMAHRIATAATPADVEAALQGVAEAAKAFGEAYATYGDVHEAMGYTEPDDLQEPQRSLYQDAVDAVDKAWADVKAARHRYLDAAASLADPTGQNWQASAGKHTEAIATADRVQDEAYRACFTPEQLAKHDADVAATRAKWERASA